MKCVGNGGTSGLTTRAEKGIRAASEVIKRICREDPAHRPHPTVIDEFSRTVEVLALAADFKEFPHPNVASMTPAGNVPGHGRGLSASWQAARIMAN